MRCNSASTVCQPDLFLLALSRSPIRKNRSPTPPTHAPLSPTFTLEKKLSAGAGMKVPVLGDVPAKVMLVLVFLKMPLLVTLPVNSAGLLATSIFLVALLVTVPLMVLNPPVKVMVPMLNHVLVVNVPQPEILPLLLKLLMELLMN